MGIELLFCYASFRIFLAIDFQFFIIPQTLGKGNRNWILWWPLLSFFQTFPPFFFWFIWWRFSWGTFFKNWIALRIRPAGADVCLFRCCTKSASLFQLLVWMQRCKFGYVSRSMSSRYHHSSSYNWSLLNNIVNWILFFVRSPIRRSPSLPFWMKPEEIFFPILRRTTDEEQFVKELFWFLIFHHNAVSLIFVFLKIG